MIDNRLLQLITEGKGFVGIMAGSGSDDNPINGKPSHIEKIVKDVASFMIPYGVHIYSAHKQSNDLGNLIKEYDNLAFPILLVAVAGGTDALSGTASWESQHPVISCPPDVPNDSCLKNPPGSSNAYIARPENVGRFAAQMFSHLDPRYRLLLVSANQKKIDSLVTDNERISKKYADMLLGGQSK